jgi:hypothetical protein
VPFIFISIIMANVILYSQLGYRPLIWRSISCYILARWIEEHGYTCQVIEFTHLFSPDDLVEYTKMFIDKDTLIIGASSTMWSTFSSDLLMGIHATSVPENLYLALTEIKNEFPKIKTIVGGHRGYGHLKNIEIFDHKADISFGEDWLLKFLDETTDKSLATKLRRKKFDISNHRFTYKDHDCILPGESLPLEWGRGCVFKCPFCRSPELGKKSGTLEKDVDLMIDQLVEMYEKFGTTSYWFIDETFNADNSRIEILHSVHKKLPFQLEFSCYMRPDLLDKNPHTQDLIYESGLRGTLFGIETFNKEASKLVLKPWSYKRGKDFLEEIFERWPRVHIDCSLIAGLPNVSENEHYETAEWFMNSKVGFVNYKPLLIIKGADSTKSTWESAPDETGIEWPEDDKPHTWKWGDIDYVRSYNLASKLNRHMQVFNMWSQAALPSLTCSGITFDQIVNKKMKEILSITGDIFQRENNLFEQYKSILKKNAGR